MVRLEIQAVREGELFFTAITFQYGLIRNIVSSNLKVILFFIYIPVWLDQKFINNEYITLFDPNLHSSMVRLEIRRRL